MDILVLTLIIIILFSIAYLQSNNDDFKTQTIKTLVRQASRWSLAAEQDTNPIIALLHANYGAGYLWALKDIANDNDIERETGINVIKFRDNIVKIQDDVTMNAIKLCSKYVSQESYLTLFAKGA